MNIKTETLTEIKVSVFAIRARGGPAQVDAKNYKLFELTQLRSLYFGIKRLRRIYCSN